jgi:hypothetical protein
MEDSVLNDIKQSKGYILGVLAFATAVSAFLTQVLQFRTAPTLAAVAGFSLLVLYVGFLVSRSEHRQKHALEAHQSLVNGRMDVFASDIDFLKEMALEAKRDALRVQLTQQMHDNPNNEDTILVIAREYFVKYHGDWYMSKEINKWGKDHDFQLPADILMAIEQNEQEKGVK